MKRLPSFCSLIASLLLVSAMPVVFPAQTQPRAAISAPAGTNADQQAIPPFVEQQLRAKARLENPPAAGLHLSDDGEAYTYASSPSALNPGATRMGGYQATLGRCLSGGIEVAADQSDISLKFWPVNDALFASPAIEQGGRLIYASRGIRYEYEFKKNGIKEDIVFETAPSKDVGLMFALKQDGGLDFKLDAKGNLLVYGPEAILSGFVQTGDDKSADLIMKARKNARKDHLLYIIPAPVILDAGGRQYKNMARYTLEEGTLTLHTDDLSGLSAPVTIDPSIVVTTTADFMAGNNEGMISFDTNAISRAVQSGGSVGAWTATASFTTARHSHTSVAYNGYLYVIGGTNDSVYFNDVQFALINPNGTIGSWTATNSFTTGRYGLTSVAYNGYLYVIGGANSSGVLNDVQFAPIHADATLGAWTTTSSFATAREGHTSVAYKGHLYVIGGNGYLSDVQFAPINANGTIGAWNATTSLPTARAYHTSVACNGYLYVIGGYNGSYLNDVRFAAIKANGTVGVWTATASFPTARARHSSVAFNGYLYVIGGSNAVGSYLNGVQFAPINANGTIGGWSASSNFTSARFGHTSVAYNGYLYVVGGYGGFPLNDVQFTPISTGPDASVGAFAATSSFITARFGHASVANDGYLYVIGGQTSGGYTNTVQYAKINGDGTLGTWTITNPFTTARSQHASVVYNGYLYVIGGLNVTAFSDVQVAPITADGLVGAWTATTSFTTARYGLASVAYNGYLYVIGGQVGGTYYNNVQYAPINANGTVGAWTATTSFTTARATHTSVVYGGYLYVIGGYGASGYLDDVRFAAINPSTGAVGAWTATTALTVPNGSHTSVVSNGCMYVIGGCNSNGCFLNDVRYAPLNANGTIGDWAATTSFTTGRDLHGSVACNGYLYILGGNDGSYLNDVQFAPFQAGGAVGSWASTTAFATARGGHASVAFNGYLYVIGGYNGTYLNDIQFAPINDNGAIGAWTATTSFTTARAYHAAVLVNNFLYVIGGYNGSYFNDVQFAPVNANGTVGGWSATTGFTTARGYHTSALFNGYLYVLGGYNGSYLNDVQYALINAADGTVGAWTATTSFTTPRFWHTSVAYNGHLYMIGGTCNTGNLNDVQFALINADGTVGSWVATTNFTYARKAHAAVARNGYLYVLGGYNGMHLNDVQYAPIYSDGTLGAWDGTTHFTTPRQMPSSVIYNGNLYVIGGYSGSTPLSDVQVVTLKGPEARGRYSKLVDLGSDQIVDSISFSNSGHNGVTNLACAVASSGTAVFGALAMINGARHSVQYGLDACGRWMWVSFDLDDTQSATIDGGGLNGCGDVLDFTVNYYALTGIGDSLDAAKTTAVHLTWTPVPGATSYGIQRCNAGGGHCTPVAIDSTTNDYYDDSVLGDGSNYWYTIAAVNGTCTAP